MKFAIRSLYFLLIPLIAGCGGCGGGGAASIKAEDSKIDNMSAKESTEDFIKGAGDLNVAKMWAHLPNKWREDVNTLVHKFAEKMDAELWNKGFAVASKAIKVIKSKKKFILASPMMKSLKEKPTEKQIDDIVKLLSTIVDSELKDLNNVKKMDVGAYLAGTLTDLKSQIEAMSSNMEGQPGNPLEKLNEFKNAKVEVEEEKGDNATLKVTVDGKTKSLKFVKIEKRWVPEDLSKEWDKNISEAKDGIEKLSTERMEAMKPGILAGMAMIEGVLDQLQKAETQEDFDKAVEGIGKLMGSQKGPGGPGPIVPPPR